MWDISFVSLVKKNSFIPSMLWPDGLLHKTTFPPGLGQLFSVKINDKKYKRILKQDSGGRMQWGVIAVFSYSVTAQVT